VAAAVAQVAGQVRAVIVPASVAEHGYPASNPNQRDCSG